MLEEIGSPDRADAYVADRLARHEKVMGFGHAVYKTMDPRARILKRLSKETGERHGDASWFEISEAIERAVAEQKGLYPNVDFYAASVYHAIGIPTDLMTPIFALARMSGWTAHVREQYADNRVIRPGSSTSARPTGAGSRSRSGPRANSVVVAAGSRPGWGAEGPVARSNPPRRSPRPGSGAPARTRPSRS